MYKNKFFYIVFLVLLSFFAKFSGLDPLLCRKAFAYELELPEPVEMLNVTADYAPLALRGMQIHPDDPLTIDFIIDQGDTGFSEEIFKEETARLIRYFLAGVAVAASDLWVNLSPYESDRVIPDKLAETNLGSDMLAQDYILKQFSASLTHPDTLSGQEYWRNFADGDVSKIWISPEYAEIFDGGTKVLLGNSSLMIKYERPVSDQKMVREITKEVNHGKHFASLRQIYSALILAEWFKQKVRNSIYDASYVNKNKIKGIGADNPGAKDKIYHLYCEAFERGVYDLIKKDDKTKKKRRFFSGGLDLTKLSSVIKVFDIRQTENLPETNRATIHLRPYVTDDRTSSSIKAEILLSNYRIDFKDIQNDVELFEDALKNKAESLGYSVFDTTKFILHVGDKVDPAETVLSRSKYFRIFNKALLDSREDIVFVPVNTESTELDQLYLLAGKSERVLGLNVTSPYKENIFERLGPEETDDSARISGSVNGLIKKGGNKKLGITSDGNGWVYWFTRYLNKDLFAEKIVILGAGGATRSLVMAIADEADNSEVVLCDHDYERAERLVIDVRECKPGYSIQSVTIDHVNSQLGDSDIVLNFTGSGKSYDDRDGSGPDIDYSLLRGKVAVDANYRFSYPENMNEFLRRARENGAEIYNGLGFLVGTVPPLFEAFTGKQVDFDSLMSYVNDTFGSGLTEPDRFSRPDLLKDIDLISENNDWGKGVMTVLSKKSINSVDQAVNFMYKAVCAGDIVKEISGADRMNYEFVAGADGYPVKIFILPRFMDEPEELKNKPASWYIEEGMKYNGRMDKKMINAVENSLKQYEDNVVPLVNKKVSKYLQDARDNKHDGLIKKMETGWLVMANGQNPEKIEGWSILLSDPEYASIDNTPAHLRRAMFHDMIIAGRAILVSLPDQESLNGLDYSIMGNDYPVLHAHFFPRRITESEKMRALPPYHHKFTEEDSRKGRFRALYGDYMDRVAENIKILKETSSALGGLDMSKQALDLEALSPIRFDFSRVEAVSEDITGFSFEFTAIE